MALLEEVKMDCLSVKSMMSIMYVYVVRRCLHMYNS